MPGIAIIKEKKFKPQQSDMLEHQKHRKFHADEAGKDDCRKRVQTFSTNLDGFEVENQFTSTNLL